ncbi:MAG: prolipoprotein diacylglyceryl transferase [Treponema bryantii]|nr:prolipoprotein diacylglyceryl transferase [Treponema bryantii]
MFLYINYPSWIKPEIFPGVPFLGFLRWYGLMYVFAFATAFLVLKKVAKEGSLDTPTYKITEDDLFSFISTGIVFLLIGARVFSTLIYDTSGLYWKKPWLIFWPFDSNMHFTGFAGMSYHGGFVGGLLGMIIWCKRHKQPILKWIDAMVCAIPLGYTFGRLGNFLNGELYGRITTMPWGVVFPDAEKFSSSLPWVKEIAAKIGMNISNMSLVNLPRHPSQLYEAFFEGIVLWAIIWLCRKHKKFDGTLACIYTGGYGIFRFIIEYFREPDADIGYRIAKDSSAPIYTNTSLLNFSTGQILCFLMILAAILGYVALYFYNKKKSKTN